MKALVSAIFLLFLAASALALPHPNERLNDPALEARADALSHQLRCVVCQNESIADSPADIARELRLVVRKQILDGKTDAQVIAFLRERYGDYILLQPPFTARTYLLWLAPLLVLMIGAALVYPAFRRKRK